MCWIGVCGNGYVCVCNHIVHPSKFPSLCLSRTRGGEISPYVLCWPSLADVNTRARRLVNAYLKQQKRDELRQVQLVKVSQLQPAWGQIAELLALIMEERALQHSVHCV